MKKYLTLLILAFITQQVEAQIQVAKIVGKNSDNYTTGYGGFIKLSYQITKASDVSLEIGALVFSLKNDKRYGLDLVPLKLGFRYILTNKSSGPYVEPQLGYNVYGIDETDQTFTGFIWGAGVGYLFKPIGKLKFDLGIKYESAAHSGGALNYFMIRLSHNFSVGRRANSED
jgi:hypothetical protein